MKSISSWDFKAKINWYTFVIIVFIGELYAQLSKKNLDNYQ